MKQTRDQRKFYTVYRGRHSGLRHLAYMRIGKIAAARLLLERNKIDLRDISLFDYGFGPGTFFLHCDQSCRLAGVELDPVNVESVQHMLRVRGYENVDLAAVKVTHWNEHRLLYGRYDLILLSHVLEHLDDPVGVLQRLDDCLPDHGMILGLLPLNETSPDENHKWVCDRALVEKWAAEAGYSIEDYLEVDHYVYYTLPVFHAKGRLGRLAAQTFSLGLGVAASCMTPRTWFSIGERAGRLIGTKPTQAVFLLKPVRGLSTSAKSAAVAEVKEFRGKTTGRPADVTNVLRCPSCDGTLECNGGGAVACANCATEFPMVENVLRFAPTEGYTSSFGYQWKKFSKVQLDSCNGTDFSESRFRSITGWGPETLNGKRVLDVGCGAGRFTEIALKFGANVISADLSEAVEACRANNPSEDLLVCQASIYELPFAEGSFDNAFCIGVIQHTPDPHESIRKIARMVKPGGQMGLWIYERDWKAYVGTVAFKYIFRPYTKNLSMEEQIGFSKRIVDLFFPVARWSRDKGVFGKIIMRLLPVSSAHLQGIPLSDEDFKQWIYLDTFDMYSPAHDHPQKYDTIAKLLEELGFTDIRRMPHGGISIVGTKL